MMIPSVEAFDKNVEEGTAREIEFTVTFSVYNSGAILPDSQRNPVVRLRSLMLFVRTCALLPRPRQRVPHK